MVVILYVIFGFNSLQTGKRIQSMRIVTLMPNWPRGFNSLQTGKRIQSCKRERKKERKRVSIPFKRESVAKAYVDGKYEGRITVFQFPSNGKAYPKATTALAMITTASFNSLQTGKRSQSGVVYADPVRHSVSIPFKRESVAKANVYSNLLVRI